MKTDTPQPIRLSDYEPAPYVIERVSLDFRLAPEQTRIVSRLSIRANPKSEAKNAPLVLDGEHIELRSLELEGMALAGNDYVVTDEHLTIAEVPDRPFTLKLETICNPAANTALSGLYRTNETYCTQCEAEGFRRMTYFLDRPDNLAIFTTRIEARKGEAPVLLSNGNPAESGEVEGTERHFAVWHDPFPKPSYLFALVAGDLACTQDHFVTMSGREVGLRIYVEPGKEDRTAYAMGALKRAMRWDEERFGREYDLDIFIIVAVSDFNMGAMENKGLNVFNDKFILARPDTATDADFSNIEAIIAHEYFHNWTGNRITCRDWFQLCLKEGLTVFRDQEFTSDMRSRPVKRISDVRLLRSHQFPEDAGPLAHPVRPDSYIEINNFYTATVYEKGAEVIRMLKVLIGEDAFARGMDLYFARHDGDAATMEDFIAVMAEGSDRDLGQFFRWYLQSGTPELAISGTYDKSARTFRLNIAQTCPPTPGQTEKKPFLMPLCLALLGPNGEPMPLALKTGHGADDLGADAILEIDGEEAEFVFENIGARPVASLNRNFSAPVRITSNMSEDDLRFLMIHDDDPFNRWEAGQGYALARLKEMVAACIEGRTPGDGGGLGEAWAAHLDRTDAEPALTAQLLQLPSEQDLAREIAGDVDPGAIHEAREHLLALQATGLMDALVGAYNDNAVEGPYSPDDHTVGMRSLRAVCLGLIAAGDAEAGAGLATAQYEAAENMTDAMSALAVLAHLDRPEGEAALADFHARWKDDHLVTDKWFALQASAPFLSTLDTVRKLLSHPSFSMSNPNKVRALIGTFAGANPYCFNREDGEGYRFIAEMVLVLDRKNPQVAARLAGAFRGWRMLEAGRQARAKEALKSISDAEKISRDTGEIVSRLLA